jgi:hypothetical protein
MKNYIILASLFVSFISFAYSGLFEYDLLGGTELNGSGCVCHTTERDTSVTVWIEGPDTLYKGQTGFYRMYLANGPAEAGGYNVAGRFGTMSLVDTFSVWDYRSPNELTQAFPLLFPTPQDTIYWDFAYTAPDSVLIDTLYSCGLSIVYDHIPDFHDRWNFGPKFPVIITDNIVPVELVSFSSFVDQNNVTLIWVTSTERNNLGFEIQRNTPLNPLLRGEAEGRGMWAKIGFVNGSGTTIKTHSYSFKDENLSAGKYEYRLKQIDLDGTFNYSNSIEAEITKPNEFVLEQNYPNPFNPNTTIRYSIPSVISTEERNLNVILKVFDIIGNEIATLVNEEKAAGSYEINFAASHLSSGIYFYELQAGNFIQTRKMLLMK